MEPQEFDGEFLLSGFGHIGTRLWLGCGGGQAALITGAFVPARGAWPGSVGLMGVRATTNLVENPSFETNVTGFWLSLHNSTASQIANAYLFGRKALQLDVTSAGAAYIENATLGSNGITVSASTAYSFSAYVRTPADDSSEIKLQIHWWKADNTYLSTSECSYVKSPGRWTRISVSATSPATAERATLRMYMSGTAGTDYARIDGVQFEQSAAPTPFCDGTLNNCSWSSTAHLSTSSRTATDISFDAAAAMLTGGEDAYSIRCVVQMPYDYDDVWPDAASLIWIINDSVGGGRAYLYYDSTNDALKCYVLDQTAGDTFTLIDTGITFEAGDWLDVVVTFDHANDDYKLYVNGSEEDTDTTANVASFACNMGNLGSDTGATGQANFVFAEFAIWVKELSSTEISGFAKEPLVGVEQQKGTIPMPIQTWLRFGYMLNLVPSNHYLGWVTKESGGAGGDAYVTIGGQYDQEGLVITEEYADAWRDICSFKWGGGAVVWAFDPGDAATSVTISSPEALTLKTTSGKLLKLEATGAGGDVEIAAADDLVLNADKLIAETYPVCARVYHNANQAIPDGTDTILAFNSERHDNDDLHDTVTNNSRLTVSREGLYLITVQVKWESDAAHERHTEIVLNRGEGSEAVIAKFSSTSMSNPMSHALSTVWQGNAADFFEVRVYQNSGGALDIQSTPKYSPEFTITQLS